MKHFFLLMLGLSVWVSLRAQPQPDPCLQGTSFRIVVLGSSTAAGAGASTGDSAWVNRYRRYLQTINPQNEVINLAVGGFVTYRIMPDFFVPPSGRPLPDTAHNISKALSLNPDALIVNLPSNDRQYPMQEQLDNFDSLFHYANHNGVPVWICTTQPVNSPVHVAYQMAVRDSILSRYGLYALDFWNGVADTTTGMIDTALNADGVHLNDAGHRVLFQKGVNHNIPGALVQLASSPNVAVTQLIFDESDRCGDSSSLIKVVLVNLGQPSGAFPVQFASYHAPSGYLEVQVDTLGQGLGSCVADTLSWRVNLSAGGNYIFSTHVKVPGDSISTNDSLQMNKGFLGQPEVETWGDTVCLGQSAVLRAQAGPQDTLFWYDSPQGGNRIGAGGQFFLPALGGDSTLYVEAIRGDLFFRNSLSTTSQANINWNGAMFDLLAGADTLVIDSFTLKVADPGSQGVEVYYKVGSHLGSEQNASAWTLLGQASVNVPAAETFVTAPVGGLLIPAGDSVGIYIQMQNSSARLSYQSAGSPVSYSSPELTLLAGSGSSHNFGGSFFPRVWNGTVYYHFGDKPDGDCQSERIAVSARLDQPPTIDLGGDTLACRQVLLDPGGTPGLRYFWSTGDSTSTLQVDSTGVYWVEGSNACGRSIDAVYVEIEVEPTAGFVIAQAGLTVAMTDHSRGAGSYHWEFGDGSSSVLPNPTHTYSQSGTYEIRQVVANSCGKDTFSQEITLVITDLDVEVLPPSARLFPNPAQGTVFLEWEGKEGTAVFTDVWGRHWGSMALHRGKNEIDLTPFPEGVYFVMLHSKKDRFTLSLIKQN